MNHQKCTKNLKIYDIIYCDRTYFCVLDFINIFGNEKAVSLAKLNMTNCIKIIQTIHDDDNNIINYREFTISNPTRIKKIIKYNSDEFVDNIIRILIGHLENKPLKTFIKLLKKFEWLRIYTLENINVEGAINLT